MHTYLRRFEPLSFFTFFIQNEFTTYANSCAMEIFMIPGEFPAVSFTAAEVQSAKALGMYETGKFCDNLLLFVSLVPSHESLARVGKASAFSYWNNYHTKLVQQSPPNEQLVFLLSMRMQSRGRRLPPFWTSSSTFHNLFRVSLSYN
jgi:hypothetical protein